MLKGRARDPRTATQVPPHLASLPPMKTGLQRLPLQVQRAPLAKPEPDYEVVEFPTDQYVNAKLQPPPPPPPRPTTGHPQDLGASCGLCGGGGARVRCLECGRRALCASCDDMYHRHPKRRNHQRLALSPSQLREDRPPLPPKGTPPVPPPRRHKLAGDRSSASPRPTGLEQRRATVGHVTGHISNQMTGHVTAPGLNARAAVGPFDSHSPPMPPHLQGKFPPAATAQPPPAHLGSMPYLPNAHHAAAVAASNPYLHSNTLQHNIAWGRQRGSLQGFNVPPNMGMATEPWESPDSAASASGHSSPWGRPLRRNASVLELGPGVGCGCAPQWRYPQSFGSCTSLEPAWPQPAPGWPPTACCAPHPFAHPHAHVHAPHTPQAYRRDSRAASRGVSRAGSRATSPAASVRSRASRRHNHKPRSPSPPLPSSDADSESDSESDRGPRSRPRPRDNSARNRAPSRASLPAPRPVATPPPPAPEPELQNIETEPHDDGLGPAPPPPDVAWQCEHCTFENEAGVRVCAVCCRTPTAAPRVLAPSTAALRVPAAAAAMSAPVVADLVPELERLRLNDKSPPSPVRVIENVHAKQNDQNARTRQVKERTSTGCGPSPPRENAQRPASRLTTPTREHNRQEPVEPTRARHEVGIGPSPPRDTRTNKSNMGTGPSPPREQKSNGSPMRHSISVGPSPPRDLKSAGSNAVLKKTTGTSPPRDAFPNKTSTVPARANVSNTGTSPPPQTISTQTYEVPDSWERASSASRSRQSHESRQPQPQPRFRDEHERRERSHSRHSLSSDTRDSERSARTSGGGASGGAGRWEWREMRDSSPGGEWSEAERRRGRDGGRPLARRASHLDLRHTRPARRHAYGSEAPSPEPLSSSRALSVEALATSSARREAERGLELARLMSDAERLGFSAAEVQAALAQSPAAPLAWLRGRWPGLCAGVAAAAQRLAGVQVSDSDARAALARHKGQMWPAVTDCVDRFRRQASASGVGEERRLRGHVWGSPAGADDDAAPPPDTRRRSLQVREDSSDEFEAPIPTEYRHDDWMFLPIDKPAPVLNNYDVDSSIDLRDEPLPIFANEDLLNNAENVALKLKSYLMQAGVPTVNEDMLLRGLLADNSIQNVDIHQLDLGQSENDFIEAYNALARSNPIQNVTNPSKNIQFKIGSSTKSHDRAPLAITTIDTSAPRQDLNHPNSTNQSQKSIITEKPIPKSSLNIHPSTSSQSSVNEEKYVPKSTTLGKKSPKSLNKTKKSNNGNSKHQISDNKQNQSQYDNEDKSTNLSEIVDNTQKLIQQMKAEINSDINSLDGQSLSYSEAENSSNESDFSTEHESSYSESGADTEDLTSDENVKSSHGEEKEQSDKNDTLLNRTSSEENEQFEEAMDHIEEQNESFKQTNMELLDSIARSLQEDHTMIVEANERSAAGIPVKVIASKENSPNQNLPQETTTKSRRQDHNNNVFAKVSSFEEIYEQLSPNVTETTPSPIPEKENSKSKPNLLLERLEVNISAFIPDASNQPEITELHHESSKAVIESVEVDQDMVIDNYESNIDIKTASENEDDSNDSSSDASKRTVSPMKEKLQKSPSSEKQFGNGDAQSVTLELNDLSNNRDAPDISIEANNTSNASNSSVSNKTISNQSSIDSKNSASGKSNIPKLIRVFPNNKAKSEIRAPHKVIASKVPVRRGSLKHYPAPGPPKTGFGSIQNGHVKQLQTRLFNHKAVKMTVNTAPLEAQPSTSHFNKKRPAPPPPTSDKKQTTPPNTSSPNEKKHYFRESCRTEDEWTDSDSEDSKIIRQNSDEPQRQPSPPPPITVRRVSGQLIDLARVRILEGSPERQARMLLAEGAMENWEQARLAVELVARGADPPAALLAALECTDLNSALTYLHQDCELCASRLPEHEMVSMLRCTHRCCRECARHYFTVQITERSIVDCVCPYCKDPELENLSEDEWLEYFAHLDILLKTLIENDTHELFQRKLRDRTLARDPNFRWCVECSSGFFVHPKHKKLRCPECKSVTCASCRKPWTANHEGLSCDEYTAWLEDNDPERSVAAVQQHLRENGIDCPRCNFKYSLSRGGCMHFTCTQCKYEFCYGCGKPFMMGARCGLSDYCAKLGLHAHHPRNCLFYLRDKEVQELQTLLQMNNVKYETENGEGSNGRCPVQLQKETPTGLVDTTCGGEVPPNHGGLCKNHYLEYLSRLVRGAKIDPLPLLGVDDLETLVRRAALRLPPRPYGSLEGLYKRAMLEVCSQSTPSCRTHYVEMLAGLARGLDPIPIMDVPELVAELRRRAIPLPERGPWDTDPIYAGMCAEIVREKIPLD